MALDGSIAAQSIARRGNRLRTVNLLLQSPGSTNIRLVFPIRPRTSHHLLVNEKVEYISNRSFAGA